MDRICDHQVIAIVFIYHTKASNLINLDTLQNLRLTYGFGINAIHSSS